MAAVAAPLSSIRGFRTSRRVNARLLVASGLAILSMLALLVGLGLIVPETQSVLQAMRDPPAGTTVQPGDITAVRVRVPETMLGAAYAADATEASRRDRRKDSQ